VQIHSLLSLLALFAFEPSAHLVLDYLIRRYKVHEMNSNVLIACMIVAHDTKVFIKIIITFDSQLFIVYSCLLK